MLFFPRVFKKRIMKQTNKQTEYTKNRGPLINTKLESIPVCVKPQL